MQRIDVSAHLRPIGEAPTDGTVILVQRFPGANLDPAFAQQISGRESVWTGKWVAILGHEPRQGHRPRVTTQLVTELRGDERWLPLPFAPPPEDKTCPTSSTP